MTPATFGALWAVREQMVRRNIREEAIVSERLRAAVVG